MAEEEEQILASPSLLASKSAEADHQYALRNYSAAAELYSEATTIQAELNGEMALENAELLYAYGRCLYHVGVSNSEVLGGKVAGEKNQDGADGKRGKKRKKGDDKIRDNGTTTESASASGENKTNGKEEKLAEAVMERTVELKEGFNSNSDEKKKAEAAPFLQIEGDDEDWADSDEEGGDDREKPTGGDNEDDGEEEEEDEEEDDFAIAYEVLDIARVLLQKRLEDQEKSGTIGASDVDDYSKLDKGKQKESLSMEENFDKTNPIVQTRERLADTHDLQGEIQLEGERFALALADFRSALQLKQKTYPAHSSIIAEAHYKVSLALEFASVTSNKDMSAEGSVQEAEAQQTVDEEMRAEAATHMEAAIASSRSRIDLEASKVASSSDLSPEERSKRRKEIEDVKEMIGDMEQRLQDLRGPLVSLAANPNNPALATAASTTDAGLDPLRGILGSVLGESVGERTERIEAATKDARDLSGLVRSKKRKNEEQGASGNDSESEKRAKLKEENGLDH